jgi:hypothetical protein
MAAGYRHLERNQPNRGFDLSGPPLVRGFTLTRFLNADPIASRIASALQMGAVDAQFIHP